MRHYQVRECYRWLLTGAEERLRDSAVDLSCLGFGTVSVALACLMQVYILVYEYLGYS